MKPKHLVILTALLIFFGSTLEFFVNFQRVAVPGTIFTELQTHYALNAGQITAMGAWFMLCYAFGQFLIGPFIDGFGGVRSILLGGFIFTIGVIMFPLACTENAPCVPLLYLARALAGIGASGIFLAVAKLVLEHFPKQESIIISIMIAIGVSGGIFAGAPLAKLLECFALQRVFLYSGYITLILFVICLLLSKWQELPPVGKMPFNLKNYLVLLKRKNNVVFWIFFGISYGSCYVLQTIIGKKFLEDFCKMKEITAAWTISVMGIASVAGGFLFSFISMALGNRRKCIYQMWVIISLFVFGGLIAQLCFGMRSGIISSALFTLLALPTCISGVTIPYIQETNSPELIGTATSMGNFSAYLAVAIFGNMTGLILKSFPANSNGVYGEKTYIILFAVLFALLIPAAICTHLMIEPRKTK